MDNNGEKHEETLSTTCSEHAVRPSLARILSPLAIYAIYLIYLIFYDTSPFLIKWLEGSFAFFLALVMCNVIRNRLTSPGDAPKP